MGWLLEDFITDYIEGLATSAINMFLQFMTELGEVGLTLLDSSLVTSIIFYTQGLAISLLIVKFVYQIWVEMALYNDGESSDPGQSVKRLIMAVMFVMCTPWITKYIYNIGLSIATDVANLPGGSLTSLTSNVQFLTQILIYANSYMVFIAIAIIIALVMLIIVVCQSLLRAAELTMISIVGIVYAVTAINEDGNLYTNWFKDLIAVSITQAVQLVMLKITFYSAVEIVTSNKPILCIGVFLAFLFLTIKYPNVLKGQLHSTGVGRSAGGGAKMAGQLLMRKLIMK